MKRNFYLISFLFVIICAAMSVSSTADAERVKLNIKDSAPIIYDGADVFTDYEEIDLASEFSNLYNANGFRYIIITLSDVKDYTAGHALENIYDDHKPYMEADGIVLFLINTDKNDSFCELQGYNEASTYIPHEICSYINDQLNGYIKDEEYYTAVNELLVYLNKIQTGELTSEAIARQNQSSISYIIKNSLPLTLFILFISFAVSAVIIFFIIRSGRKKFCTKELSTESVKVCTQHDIYVRSVINHYGKS